ncbi:hypothetical protein BJF93_07395 [Xaviernesmea oryzae]|uniref:TadE-like domain-containing protein n=1 Tax=Xaviernesmea oryzae TaxID=464029 RepID=A0A1Q9B1N9_9HYPH|nr:TadE family protein [Xaviernesmea oryzae]OLP61943.1 hypothetical protein BJF93_07395 [Xaviernesmea oryzae]SEL00363.1 TadE-like protein [Xaviernesmea oryzae]
MTSLLSKLVSNLRLIDLCKSRRGIAAVEFAFIAPVMLVMMTGVSELGVFVFKRMQANEAVSAAANAALASGPGLSSSTADATANVLASILRAPDTAGTARMTINGLRAYDITATQMTSSGSVSSADECRCPTQANGVIDWGGSVGCTSTCADGSSAGRYISIAYHRPYKPVFPTYGLISNNGITVNVVALVQ